MEGILSMYQLPLDFVEAMNQHSYVTVVNKHAFATETSIILYH